MSFEEYKKTRFGRGGTKGVDMALVRSLLATARSTAPQIVAAAKATTPPTLTGGNTGSTLVIPTPAGAQPGDRALSVVQGIPGSAAWTPPPGWTLLEEISVDRFRVETRVLQAGDPSEWTWTYSQANHSRSGCIIVVRGGSIGQSAIAEAAVSPFTLPDVEAFTPGSLFLGLVASSFDLQNTESYAANPPLVIQTQHVARGSRSYQAPVSSAIFAEEDVLGIVSGRSFLNPDADSFSLGMDMVSLVIEVA